MALERTPRRSLFDDILCDCFPGSNNNSNSDSMELTAKEILEKPMVEKKKLLKVLINSLINHSEDWYFNEYTATNVKNGVELWINNIPVLDLGVHKPTKIIFSIPDRFRLYKAMNQCRAKHISSLFPESK